MKTIAALMEERGMGGAVSRYAEALKPIGHVQDLKQAGIFSRYDGITVASLMNSGAVGKLTEVLDGRKNILRLSEQYARLTRLPENPFHVSATSLAASIPAKSLTKGYLSEQYIRFAEQLKNPYQGFVKSLGEPYAEALKQTTGKGFVFDGGITAASLVKDSAIGKWREALDGRKNILRLSEQYARLTRLPENPFHGSATSLPESLRKQMAEYRGITAASFLESLHEQQKKSIQAAREAIGLHCQSNRQETVEINIPPPPVMQALAHNPLPAPDDDAKLPKPKTRRARKRRSATRPNEQAVISAYMSEIGRKGNHSYGETKRRIIEHFIREHRETGISKNQFADKYHTLYNRSRSTVRDILKGVRV